MIRLGTHGTAGIVGTHLGHGIIVHGVTTLLGGIVHTLGVGAVGMPAGTIHGTIHGAHLGDGVAGMVLLIGVAVGITIITTSLTHHITTSTTDVRLPAVSLPEEVVMRMG